MKTVNNIYEQITSFRNLLLAAQRAEKCKRLKNDVQRFNIELEGNILRLQKELINKTYKPGRYKSFRIFEPKPRIISAAPYADRVVHHAMCNVIEPIFEKYFIYDTYANRLGKGTHKAILRYQEFSRRNTYVLKLDIRKYFPSIDHEILKKIIRKKIRCSDTLWLIDRIIDNSNPQEDATFYFTGDNLFTPLSRRKGIPIGNLTSQFFANIYLSPLDHFIKNILRLKYYIRYVDDMVVFGNDKKELNEIKEKINRFLEQYRLKLHDKKSRVYNTCEGVRYLGHKVFPGYSLLHKENLQRFRKKLNSKLKLFEKGELSLEKLSASVQGWQGHAAFSNTYRLRSKILNDLKIKGVSLKLVSCGAAHGTTTTTTAVPLTATGTNPTTGTTTTGFVSPVLSMPELAISRNCRARAENPELVPVLALPTKQLTVPCVAGRYLPKAIPGFFLKKECHPEPCPEQSEGATKHFVNITKKMS